MRILADVSVVGPGGPYPPRARNMTQVHEADIKAWLIDWDRSLKTKANYHGLLFGVFNHALELGFITVNPCQRTAPKRSRIRQSQACGSPTWTCATTPSASTGHRHRRRVESLEAGPDVGEHRIDRVAPGRSAAAASPWAPSAV